MDVRKVAQLLDDVFCVSCACSRIDADWSPSCGKWAGKKTNREQQQQQQQKPGIETVPRLRPRSIAFNQMYDQLKCAVRAQYCHGSSVNLVPGFFVCVKQQVTGTRFVQCGRSRCQQLTSFWFSVFLLAIHSHPPSVAVLLHLPNTHFSRTTRTNEMRFISSR